MKRLYAAPLRVYLCLSALALAGIIAGFQLPISLFPNSSKPIIGVHISYGHQTPSEFLNQYGNRLEPQLQSISTESAEVEKTRATYAEDGVHYEVEFRWGTLSRAALREVEAVVRSFSGQFPEEIRNAIGIYPQGNNSGFFAASFSSSSRTLDELYSILEPVLMPQISKLQDVSDPDFWNPSKKEIRIELNNDRMAAFQLLPRDIEQAVRGALSSFSGGSITVGLQQLTVQVPRVFESIDDFNNILIPTPAKKSIHLTDVAKVDYDIKSTNAQSWKTSGMPSLLLFARPRPGGNVKRMAEEMIEVIQSTVPSLPSDIQTKILVDPSEFIRSAVKNVFHEVAIGALLAVMILWVFIGSFKNTVTAAIEIPLSMVMAFIPMKLAGMSLNLVSLGGLALSAGMNVDASVVVMENIFRHFENTKERLNSKEKLRILVKAVNEVKFSVIASTIASLVVFLPLAFTSELTNAILGDLAKAVVFSHGFSAFVALILVPTVRLQLMSHGGEKIRHSPFENSIRKLEEGYVHGLERFLKNKKLQRSTYISLGVLLVLLSGFIIPRLPKEVIGKPDTSDMMININTQGNVLLKQMEETSAEVESRLLERFKKHIDYTLVNTYQPNGAWIIAHLKDKKEMRELRREMEAFFVNTPTLRYNVNPFNPAEMNIPDPPQLRIAIRGGILKDRAEVTRDLYHLLEENQVFPRLWSQTGVGQEQNLTLKPHLALWSNLKSEGASINTSDLADLVRVMTSGRKIGELNLDGYPRDITLRYASPAALTPEEIGAIPIGLGDKIVPLKALAQIKTVDTSPAIYREDQREVMVLFGQKNEGDPAHLTSEKLRNAEEIVKKFEQERSHKPSGSLTPDHGDPTGNSGGQPAILFEDAGKDLHEAMRQLSLAVVLSIALIFLILMIQFGDLVNALLVLVAVPLGFIGVLGSLFVFGSTLSLNSILGVILLNGIAVANSIILVDFLKQRVGQGLTPYQAALDAGRKRIRPILITSLTTILGMLPVALGLGEGGRVLQPLGIAVAGGLWVSMALTLFIVPALQVDYLNWKKKRRVSLSIHETDLVIAEVVE